MGIYRFAQSADALFVVVEEGGVRRIYVRLAAVENVVAILDESRRTEPESIRSLLLKNRNGALVPLERLRPAAA
jgi:multidrug efflux pump subunit AcrB